jgi:hypothetical protein
MAKHPSLVILPPDSAEVAVMSVTEVVVKVGGGCVLAVKIISGL